MPLPVICCQMHSVSHCTPTSVRDQWLYTKNLWTEYHTNHSWELHQIYNLGAVGNKGELIRFKVKRSKVKVTARPVMVKIRWWTQYFINCLWEFHQIVYLWD